MDFHGAVSAPWHMFHAVTAGEAPVAAKGFR
jgi:hypothetical protein